MQNFTLGADPEVFVRRRGKPVPAHDMVPGTKDSPHPVTNGAIQVDGLALEFNIDPVNHHSPSLFNRNVEIVLKQLREEAKKNHNQNVLCFDSVQEFDEETMAALPEDAKVLGCDPDFCAYTLEPNPRPDGEVNWRGAGGHIHIGWGEGIPVENPEHIQICADFIKVMDVAVGFYMTIIDPESRRREMYGKAGAFRPKPYGVEYRTPSNVWLANRKRRMMIPQLTSLAIAAAFYEWPMEALCGYPEDRVREIIDTGDWAAAKIGHDHFTNKIYAYGAKAHVNAEYQKRLTNNAAAD